MTQNAETVMEEFEQSPLEPESKRSLGIFAIIAILAIVGIAIYMILRQGETA